MHNKNLNANQGKETQLQGKWNIKYSQKPIHDHCFLCGKQLLCRLFTEKWFQANTCPSVFDSLHPVCNSTAIIVVFGRLLGIQQLLCNNNRAKHRKLHYRNISLFSVDWKAHWQKQWSLATITFIAWNSELSPQKMFPRIQTPEVLHCHDREIIREIKTMDYFVTCLKIICLYRIFPPTVKFASQ